jgi:hypothetical protein
MALKRPGVNHRAAVVFHGAAVITRPDRRALLQSLYGFELPDDVFQFWEFANRLRPLEPLQALSELNGLHLVGPFEVLAGRFDRYTPRLPFCLHWRYHDDPPEFFTVLAGGDDGFHRGYYFDDPAEPSPCITSYFTNAPFEMHSEADSLFEAVRLDLERSYRDCDEQRLNEPSQTFDCEMKMREIDAARTRLVRFATGDRPETGEEYEERYPERSARSRRVVAATLDGMGIIVPKHAYRALEVKDKALWRRLRTDENPTNLVSEAMEALRSGFPGTALKLGKDLHAIGGEMRSRHAVELLDAAYGALGREVLRNILREHQKYAHLPSVDILENDQN